jgi:hypothetical protein
MAAAAKATKKAAKPRKLRGFGKTAEFNGERFPKVSCHRDKETAEARASEEKAKGKRTRVKQDATSGNFCVFSKK